MEEGALTQQLVLITRGADTRRENAPWRLACRATSHRTADARREARHTLPSTFRGMWPCPHRGQTSCLQSADAVGPAG